MKPRQIVKICVDLGMMIALMFLMTYEMIGQAAHEWLGMGMFLLLIIHHLLNLHWFKNLFHGRYPPYRTVQTGIVICILLTMLGSMVSGIVLSQSVFDFLDISGGTNVARNVHMLSAYWGFVLMGQHLGFHWNMFVKMAGKCFNNKSAVRTWILQGLVIAISLYGIYAFYLRNIGRYMFLIDHFVFFDFSEPLYRFMFDYMAIMGLMVAIGYIIGVRKDIRAKIGKQPGDEIHVTLEERLKSEQPFSSVDEYIASYNGDVQSRMKTLRKIILDCSPEITEKISWGMATFVLNGNLVHFSGEKKHLGFHPAPSAIIAFKDRLGDYKYSKGTIQLPYDRPMPFDLLREITMFRVREQQGEVL